MVKQGDGYARHGKAMAKLGMARHSKGKAARSLAGKAKATPREA
jgi:hypothetical protein